jgi:hypothetical protein
MIIVRDVFRLKFGKAKDAKALMQETKNLMSPDRLKKSRVLVDLVGHAYTLVLEGSYENLTDYEKEMGSVFNKSEWQTWYQKFIPLVEKSYREIFTVVEV